MSAALAVQLPGKAASAKKRISIFIRVSRTIRSKRHSVVILVLVLMLMLMLIIELTGNNITLFAVQIDVETLALDLRRDAQAECRANKKSDQCGTGQHQCNGNSNRFQLLQPKHVPDNFCESILTGGSCGKI